MRSEKKRPDPAVESLPIYGKFDLIVAGGGVSGIAAAVSAARGGMDVLLIEEGASLGREVSACFRIHTRGAEDGWAAEVLELLGRANAYRDGCMDASAAAILFDRLVLEAGRIRLALKAFPHQAVCEGGRVNGAVFASKAGRMVAMAPMVLDATEEGYVAASAGAEALPAFPPGPDGEYAFLMAFVGEGDAPDEIVIPDGSPHAGAKARILRTLWPGERLVMFDVSAPQSDASNRNRRSRVELAARELAVEFASILKSSIPAFSGSAMTASAWRARLRPAVQYKGRRDGNEGGILCEAICAGGKRRSISRGAVRPHGIEGLLLASPAADIGAEAAEALADFADAALLGEKVGRLCAGMAVGAGR